MAIDLNLNFEVQYLNTETLKTKGVTLGILRLDQIHEQVSGNKWFKLKYFLEECEATPKKGILTFGGAYSNHLTATAAACYFKGIQSIGIVRGEEWEHKSNPTLQECQNWGMQLHYINRENYRLKSDLSFIKSLQQSYPNFLIVPEGGAGEHGINGAAKIHDYIPENADFICVPVGTGTTLIGINKNLLKHQYSIGFCALKGGTYLNETIYPNPLNKIGHLETEYHFGGFGKHNQTLLQFINNFEKEHHIPLDFVYTGKMMFGVLDLLNNTEHWNNKTIICIHTGGLQGNRSLDTKKTNTQNS